MTRRSSICWWVESITIYFEIQIPESDFQGLETAQFWAEQVVVRWSINREALVKNLLEMAADVRNTRVLRETTHFQLDGVQFKCNVSTTVGSSVGIASGAAVIGGMILMPPVAIGGKKNIQKFYTRFEQVWLLELLQQLRI